MVGRNAGGPRARRATPFDPVARGGGEGARKKPLRFEVEVLPNADQKTVSLPPLESLPPSAALPATAAPAEPAATTALVPVLPVRDAVKVRPTPLSVYIAGGVTLGLAAAAGVTGGLYLHERSAADEKREIDRSAALDHHDSARLLGTANAALWVGTVGGAILTTYLYVTRPEREVVTARVLPFVTGTQRACARAEILSGQVGEA